MVALSGFRQKCVDARFALALSGVFNPCEFVTCLLRINRIEIEHAPMVADQVSGACRQCEFLRLAHCQISRYPAGPAILVATVDREERHINAKHSEKLGKTRVGYGISRVVEGCTSQAEDIPEIEVATVGVGLNLFVR